MGKMDEKEMMAISIIALIFSPFFIIGKALRGLGQSLGLTQKQKEDVVPPPPINNPTPVEEAPNKPHFYQPGEEGYTENKLDTNS